MADVDLILFDVGGVLGTDGWGRKERALAVQHFQLLPEAFEVRHQDTVGAWEEGRMTMDEYLDITIFYEPRQFTRKEFSAFMFAQSQPYIATIELARIIAQSGRYRMMTFSNESSELNEYRIKIFGLREIFSAFFTSCYLGIRKPLPDIYRRVLAITQADPARTILLDDRVQNIGPALSLGMNAIHFTTLDEARQRLMGLGVAVPG
jgi:putative hydrolase of the HAD superfamily